MEGNFRIVQESENEFIIEKEFISHEYKSTRFIGINIWNTKIPIKKWCIVNEKGEFLDWYKKHKFYRYDTFGKAKKALEDIEKYPIEVYNTKYFNFDLKK